MTGLEKILAEISQEARTAREAELAKAREEAEAILKEAARQTDAECARIREKGDKACAIIHDRAEAGNELREKRVLLEARRRLIRDALATAGDTIINMPLDKYMEALVKIAQTYAHPGAEGTVHFCQRDLDRLPADFEKTLNAALPEGTVLHFSKEPRTMYGGTIIAYGGIEENCSLRALYSVRREALLDLADETLFGPRAERNIM